MVTVIKAASAQSEDIYKVLSSSQALTAQEIASKLGILSNTVYRAVQKLIDLGLVERIDSYPVRFKSLPPQTALSLFQVAAIQNFKQQFGVSTTPTTRSDSPLISLIKDRPSLLKREEIDVKATKQSIDFIVSGHEVPDSTLLVFKQAVMRGVRVRKIIHQEKQSKSRLVDIWKGLGVEVKYLPEFEMRLLIFDKRVVYLTSFDSKNNRSAFGVRFEYAPLAQQMAALFEQNWQRAQQL